MRVWLALFLIISGVGLGVTSVYRELWLSSRTSPQDVLMARWKQDLSGWREQKLLHDGFNDLRQIQLITHSEKLKEAYRLSPLYLPTKTEGQYRLQIFMDEIDEHAFVVQYDLEEIKSGNTVWEQSTTIDY